MKVQRLLSTVLASAILLGSAGLAPQAQAGHYDGKGRYHYDNRYGDRYYDAHRNRLVDYKTGKILKGGLIGAGLGAGAGLLLERNVGKTALAGAGIGAGTQAIRYSSTLRRHPIIKTGAYGALAGAGVSVATGNSLGKGTLIGGALGAGLGALKNDF